MDLGAPIGTHKSYEGQGGQTNLLGQSNQGHSSTPIADKFTSGSHNLSGGDAVSGQYAGSGTGDALTGESHAQRTGAGVGPLGENLGTGESHHGHSHHHHHHHHNESTQTGAGFGTGVGAQGGAGGHYVRDVDNSTSGNHGHGHSGALGAGAAGAGGLGAAGAYEAGQHHSSSREGEGYNTNSTSREGEDYNTTNNNNNNNTGVTGGQTGHYGKASDGDFDRGAPVSDPKDLDTGGPHSLVYQESTGKYVHRRELEGNAEKRD